MSEKRVFLSLGSNLGERKQNLEAALELFAPVGLAIVKRSSIYETEPQDVARQPWFLNLVVECATTQFPMQVLSRVLQIERQLGRVRHRGMQAKGPRLIDVDVLLYGRALIDSPRLTVPHPRMLERRFVLEPLIEIEPSLRHPVTRRLMRDHLDQLHGQIVRLHHN